MKTHQNVLKKPTLILLLVFTHLNSINSSGQINENFINEVEIQVEALIDSTNLVIIKTPDIKNSYRANISSFDFNSQDEADSHFGKLNDNIVSFLVIWPSKEVIVELNREFDRVNWTVDDWNSYFLEKAKWY